jgi:poly-gamma-glutamate capsule biosynthesis protein CapA/YwtB (metallophosphatase superfamily)
MSPTIVTSGSQRSSTGLWAVAAVVVWLVVIALAVSYFWDRGDADAAALGTSGTTLAGSPGDGTGPASITTLASSTTTTEATTTTTTEVTTTTESTTTTTAPKVLTVAASGDVLGDRGVGLFIDKKGAAPLFANVRPLFEQASLAFVNLEGPISDKGTRADWKEYTFRDRVQLADGLLASGIDVVSMANNHAMDYGSKALLDTFARLKKAGVRWAGAGENAAAAAAPSLLITPAGMVAVLAFTDIIPGGFAAGPDSPGLNPTTPDRKAMIAAVTKAAKKAKFVVVSFHWGDEYTTRPNATQKELAHAVIDAGADLVLGHHPHVLQGFEVYKDRLIAYSLGDFVWDHYSQETGETVVVQVAIPGKGAPSFQLIPVYLDEVTGVPSPVTGDHAASILKRVAGYSADLGLNLTIRDDRAYYDPNAAPVSSE